jgi:predicted amidohydrolase YtcJ
LKADLIALGAVAGYLKPARAVAVRAARIVFVGSEREALALRGPSTEILGDGRGFVTAGFVDAHLHFVALARRTVEVDCSNQRAPSIAAVIEAIRKGADRLPAGTWVRAFGYDESFLVERRAPTIAELDHASPAHPVRLLHRTGHAAVLNSLGFARLGMAPRDVLHEPGEVLKDRIPTPRGAELTQLVRDASRRLSAAGITCFHDPTPGASIDDLDRLRGWVEASDVSQRVVTYGALEASSVTRNGERYRHAGVKVMVSEASDADAVAAAVADADRRGMQVALHAVEGGPLVVAIDALRRLGAARVRERRHRIEHAALCPPAIAAEIARCGATVVTHPQFLTSFGEKYLAELSVEEREWLYPLRTLHEARVPIAFGSDSPIAAPWPLANIQAAVERRTERGHPLAPSESIDAATALTLHTRAGAAAARFDHAFGSIADGMLADLVVLAADPATVAPGDISSISVRATVIGGKMAWAA